MGKRLKRPESVLVVIHTATPDFLLLNRLSPAFWQSVTGSMHWEETAPLETAVREVEEETGLAVSPDQLQDWGHTSQFEILPQFSHRYADDVTHNREHLFSLCLETAVPITINPKEHSEYRWVDANQALEMTWSWSNRDGIQRVIDQRLQQ